MPPQESLIFHLARAPQWARAVAEGVYPGAAEDLADGFMHFSTAAQVASSAAKHRAGETGLVLLAVDPARLGPALRWEPARGGQLFPHLYGPLPVAAVMRSDPLPLGPDGRHVFPADLGIAPA